MKPKFFGKEKEKSAVADQKGGARSRRRRRSDYDSVQRFPKRVEQGGDSSHENYSATKERICRVAMEWVRTEEKSP